MHSWKNFHTRHAHEYFIIYMSREILPHKIGSYREFPDVPTAVVMNEAIELAKRFSTEDSGRFVNGILSALLESVRPNAK